MKLPIYYKTPFSSDFKLSMPTYEEQNQSLTMDLTGGKGTGYEFDQDLPTFKLDLRK